LKTVIFLAVIRYTIILARIRVTLYTKYVIVVYETVFVKISINDFPNVIIAIYFSLFACKDCEVQHFTTDRKSAVPDYCSCTLVANSFCHKVT